MNMQLKTSPVLLFGETLLWESSEVLSLLVGSNKSFLVPTFGLVVPFGSAPTREANAVFREHHDPSHLGS